MLTVPVTLGLCAAALLSHPGSGGDQQAGAASKLKSTATSSTLKPQGAGLYVRGNIGPRTQPAIDHVFVNTSWASIEPSPGQFNWSSIDAAVNNPRVHGIRLRISSGTAAPSWVKSQTGTVAVQHNNPRNGVHESGQVPKYWTDTYLNDYNDLMKAVAARYDNNPKVLDVVMSAPMTFTDEPFIKGARGTNTLGALYAAGDNQANEQKAFTVAMADAMAAFQKTRISLATADQWQIPDGSSDHINRSWTDERSLLNDFRSKYGDKLVLQDNGVDPSKANATGSTGSTATAGSMWSYFKALSQPKGGQKGGPASDATALDTALQFGLSFMEHATWGDLSDAQAAHYDSALKANAQ